MNNDLREIAIRTDSGDAWENPFSHEDVAQAISTIRYINSKDLTENTYDLLTALEALHRQQPKPVKLKHKVGEDAALITCPVCWHSTIINFKLYKQFYPEWYCKYCGQRLIWGDEPAKAGRGNGKALLLGADVRDCEGGGSKCIQGLKVDFGKTKK